MRKLLNKSSFPVNSSSDEKLLKNPLEIQQIAEVVNVEINQLKNEISNKNLQANKVEEKDVFADDLKNSSCNSTSIKLLGELLAFLRKERLMSLLMLCRQIEKIEIENKTAIISSSDDDMMSLQTNDRFRTDILRFFESKGLSFKVKEKEVKFSEVDELKRLFGKKLIIKE